MVAFSEVYCGMNLVFTATIIQNSNFTTLQQFSLPDVHLSITRLFFFCDTCVRACRFICIFDCLFVQVPVAFSTNAKARAVSLNATNFVNAVAVAAGALGTANSITLPTMGTMQVLALLCLSRC